MARLRAGFCRKRNPFNSRQESLISFARTRVFVFWSKHPAPFLPHLKTKNTCLAYTKTTPTISIMKRIG